MVKNNAKIKCEGIVTEILPNAFFKVKLKDLDHDVLCTISGKMRKNNISVYLNDTVVIELDLHTTKRGRIIYRK